MPQNQHIIASLLFILSGCASHNPAPEATASPSQPTPPKTTTPITSNRRWQFSLLDHNHSYHSYHSYHSTSYTTIHETTATRPRIDTVRLGTYFTIRLNQLQTSTVVSGYIDSVTIGRNSAVNSQTDRIQTRTAFSGSIAPGELTLNASDRQADCTSSMPSMLGEIRPAIVTYPQSFSSTSTWTDSISTTTCSSLGIPIILNVRRSYKVIGEGSYSTAHVLLIDRTEAAHFNGDSHQEQHQVHIQGTSTGSSRIYLDVNNGALIALESTQRIETTVTSSGRVQRFIQDVTQTVQADLLINKTKRHNKT